MWNSNSLVSWLLVTAGVDIESVTPPEGGRAPGWEAGIAAAHAGSRRVGAFPSPSRASSGPSWMNDWRSTPDERQRALPGDRLVPDAQQQTHAITIDASPEAVWPWLVQIGQGRAGFYSHDRLERLFGADIHNADEIRPEWQALAVGDLVRTYRPLRSFEPLGWYVGELEPPRTLVLRRARAPRCHQQQLVARAHPGRRKDAAHLALAVPSPRRRAQAVQATRLRPGALRHGDWRASRTKAPRRGQAGSLDDAVTRDRETRRGPALGTAARPGKSWASECGELRTLGGEPATRLRVCSPRPHRHPLARSDCGRRRWRACSLQRPRSSPPSAAPFVRRWMRWPAILPRTRPPGQTSPPCSTG